MRIKVKLNHKDLQKTITQLENYRDKFLQRVQLVAERLAELGLDIAMAKLLAIGIGTYDGDSFYVEKVDDYHYKVVVESTEILFLEFGTGITYSGTRHPQSDEFGYGAGTYPGLGHWDDPNGWWYRDQRTGRYTHTYGNPPLMPMYDTAKDLRGNIELIVKEVFRN